MALTHWWRTVMAVTVCQNTPGVLDRLLVALGPWLTAQTGATSESIPPAASSMSTASGGHDEAQAALSDALDDNTFWANAVEKSLTSEDEHVSKAVYCLWRWTEWTDMPAHSKVLFRQAAKNQLRPVPDNGTPDKLVWFAKQNVPHTYTGSM